MQWYVAAGEHIRETVEADNCVAAMIAGLLQFSEHAERAGLRIETPMVISASKVGFFGYGSWRLTRNVLRDADIVCPALEE
jgi:hypothetical protein